MNLHIDDYFEDFLSLNGQARRMDVLGRETGEQQQCFIMYASYLICVSLQPEQTDKDRLFCFCVDAKSDLAPCGYFVAVRVCVCVSASVRQFTAHRDVK